MDILKMKIGDIDRALIALFRTVSIPLARFAIFTVYVWFGALKVFGLSPAAPLVHHMFDRTIGDWVAFDPFMVAFGLAEVVIGVLILFPSATRVAIPLIFLHMLTTAMPLVFLPGEAWDGFMIPTLEGQYIIKNLLIVACSTSIVAEMVPLRDRSGIPLDG